MRTDSGSIYTHTERFRPLMVDVPGAPPGLAPVAGIKNKDHEHHKVQTSVLPGVFFVYEMEVREGYGRAMHLEAIRC